jgi:4-alpha-glucanotransferase
MNRPGVAEGNWSWRLPERWRPEGLEDRLRGMVALYARA